MAHLPTFLPGSRFRWSPPDAEGYVSLFYSGVECVGSQVQVEDLDQIRNILVAQGADREVDGSVLLSSLGVNHGR